ncbi:IS66 family insertion sequence transposase protein (plasmid) [Rhizobium gallicum]|uniref:IS66 family insertion sequence transposase protein n=2 Tax=Rhizobium gallicum TaxID=56730 RepID=A0A1L5NPM0_9HYPH|nr:IS66 family insertion sequence transposase protein [Rhizobium gallicum]
MSRDSKMDVHLDVSNAGYVGRMDVIEGPTGRRRRTDAEKMRIAAESLVAGARVSEVARRYGVTRWQIYDWRKHLQDGRLAVDGRSTSAPAFATLMVDEPPTGRVIVDVVVGDVIVRAGRDAEEAHLARVIRVARMAR